MSIRRITAIVPVNILETLEKHLRGCGVPGVTVERVQGYGRHPNYFRRDLMKDNAKLVLYTDKAKVDTVIAAIICCEHECGATAGILAVDRVERLVSLADGADVMAESL
ncbi:MAG: P-II family nitrogen regulator [Burkholderiales bacterium]|nr:P-II family nitrogen regulator [Burkholderiales bacterium]